jgi:hypothetical protein
MKSEHTDRRVNKFDLNHRDDYSDAYSTMHQVMTFGILKMVVASY